MRLLLLGAFTLSGALYSAAAWRSYREEVSARAPEAEPLRKSRRHPEANLRALRLAFESGDFSDDLVPLLERSLEEAPTFYQAPFLLATFHANRAEHPDRTRGGFQAALERFPSNGRLHLTFAEWLLAPRAAAPYRVFRDDATLERREADRQLALAHIETATRLETDLTRRALRLVLRAGVPASQWGDRLPRTHATRRLLLEAVDESPRDRETREALLREFLSEPPDAELARAVAVYAAKWRFPAIAVEASERWRAAALDSGTGGAIPLATAALLRHRLEQGETDTAYEMLRETLRLLEERDFPSEVSVELLSAAGDVYANARRTALAQGLFTEAVTISPYHVRARLGLARVYRDTADLDGAREELERVLALEPENAQARELLERIERSPRR